MINESRKNRLNYHKLFKLMISIQKINSAMNKRQFHKKKFELVPKILVTFLIYNLKIIIIT